MTAEDPRARAAPNQDSFDPRLDAWVLRSYARVCAALDSPALLALGEPTGPAARQAAVAIRTAARASLRATHLAEWRAPLLASARSVANRVATRSPVDLVGAFARPWSLELAMLVAQVDARLVGELADLARIVFIDAAHSTNGTPSAPANVAATQLAAALAGAARSGNAPRTIDVQSFVALSQTLPCLLASVWQALFTHADQLARVRYSGDCTTALDELLRFAGPSRAVFRQAKENVVLSAPRVIPSKAKDLGTGERVIEEPGSGESLSASARNAKAPPRIAAGQRVILMLRDANHDPARFPEPDRLDVTRDASGHLAFGRGSHSCVGAPVVRLAVEIATNALLEATENDVPVTDVQWLDGFTIRAPLSLTVVLTPASAR
jgi:cytochrome P450